MMSYYKSQRLVLEANLWMNSPGNAPNVSSKNQRKYENEAQVTNRALQERKLLVREEELALQKREWAVQEEERALQQRKRQAQEEDCALQKRKQLIQQEDHDLQERKQLVQKQYCALQERKWLAQEEYHALHERERVVQEEERALQERKQQAQEKDCALRKREQVVQEIQRALQVRERQVQEKDRVLRMRERVVQEEECGLQEREKQAQKEDCALQERKLQAQQEDRALQERKLQAQQEDRALQERKLQAQQEDRALQERKLQAQQEDRALQERKWLTQKEDRALQERKRQAQQEYQSVQEKIRQTQKEDRALQEIKRRAQEEYQSVQEKIRQAQEEYRALRERIRQAQQEERERKRQAQQEERALQESIQKGHEEERARKQQAQQEERALQERIWQAQQEERALQERIRQAQQEERALQERIRQAQEKDHPLQERKIKNYPGIFNLIKKRTDNNFEVESQRSSCRISKPRYSRADVSPKEKDKRREDGAESLSSISLPVEVQQFKELYQYYRIPSNIQSRIAISKESHSISSCCAVVGTEVPSYRSSKNFQSSRSSQKGERGPSSQPMKETPAAEPVSLESFIFLRNLGSGAFGKVILAKDKTCDRLVAIKMVKKESDVSEESCARERNILQLSHQCPYLIHGLDAFDTPNDVCYVMEFAAKGNLREFIWTNTHIEAFTLKFIMAELVCGVEFLHDHRIIHRDLKPENILVTEAGHIKITDFGLSIMGVVLTREDCRGTAGYAAPEMVMGELYGREVDYFSLGAILYDMCLNKPAFPGMKAYYVNSEEPDYPDYLPPDWLDFLKGLLHKNPYLRLSGKDRVRTHPFFMCTKWEDVENCKVQPPDQMLNYRKRQVWPRVM